MRNFSERRSAPFGRGHQSVGPDEPPTRWAVVGQGATPNYATLYSQGIRAVLIELFWSDVEPTTEGTYITGFWDLYRARIAAAHAAGFKVILNYGLHETPSWFFAYANSHFVDQFGNVAPTSDGPNLVFNNTLRTKGQTWTNKVFTEFAADPPDIVRIGGGHFGELTYPSKFSGANSYWGFDTNALAWLATAVPHPTWRPGDANTSGQVDDFLNWYLGALINYQNWQIDSVRVAGYTGQIAVLYPDVGITDADYPGFRTSTLNGTGTSAEINGEVQHGLHHPRQIQNLPTDKGSLAIWGTWATNASTITALSALAITAGLPLMGENSGDDITLAHFNALITRATTYSMKLVMWVNYGNLPANFPSP